jgi:hypothetical protein
LIGFLIVEIATIGLTMAVELTSPVAWMQVFYLGVGSLIIMLGMHPQKISNSRPKVAPAAKKRKKAA